MEQDAVRDLINQYLAGPFRRHPAAACLAPVLSAALILVVGSYSFGMARPESDLDVEVIVPDEQYAPLLHAAGGLPGFWVHDEAHRPLVDVKVRPLAWLRGRLDGTAPEPIWRREQAESLWVYEQAVCVQDPLAVFAALIKQAQWRFPHEAAETVRWRYRDLRAGVTAEATMREPLTRHIRLGKTIEAALVLPLLAQARPHPYPKWQTWWLAGQHPRGRVIIDLCEGLLAGQPVQRQLRDVIDALLVEAGYGESLVRHFWRRL